ncbi:hypothetical protein [Chondromyces apiculatus]|uniref:von Willebrand factor C and EGF domain protein n=1 Tax=Chondromyces apiculatus DSM 436 TaxID=1192034 RepID=A0A017T363_9BACT|nr:hypothetical protein [Chondromyces apiculatus]EYF03290.1 von Willebrand factor C and EGF domain protein [Chondromyces apiculatus DSM 436]
MNTSPSSFLRSSLLALTALVPALLTGCVVVSGGDGGDDEGVCFYGDAAYDAGETFPADDGCNTCFCDSDGSVGCTERGCPSTSETCDTPSGPVPWGTDFQDDCNSCTCDEYGISCTAMWCDEGCVYEGTPYQPYESFPSIDGCNTCTCGENGAVSCTEMACECNPEEEWYRDYVADSPEACATTDYVCPENTTMFGNTCGCGCEQSAECEQTYNCMPPSDCPADLAAQCPFSEIVY